MRNTTLKATATAGRGWPSHWSAPACKLHFGSEAGTFVVSSSDLTALTELAVLLHSAFHNRELLKQHILTAGPRFLDRQHP
ncbi:Imm51 family immunity protein [Streptomyces sp. NPDC059994]|uniref:Imm51 family immunity protein n=1 Tax=Streptomyces sp. NPDC059994 TaxID=3347029 RepID=UPI0036B91D76